MDASEDGGQCVLIELALDNVTITIEPTINVSTTTDTSGRSGVTSDGIVLVLTISGNFVVKCLDKVVCNVPLPFSTPVNMDTDFDTSGITAFLLSLCESFAKAFGTAVLKDPASLTALVALMAVAQMSKEAIKSLLYRSVNDDEVIEKGEDFATSDDTSADDAASAVSDACNVVTAAEGLLDALSALGTVAGAMASFVTVSDSCISMLGVLIPNLSDATSWATMLANAKTRSSTAQASVATAYSTVLSSLNMGGPSQLTFQIPSSVLVD